MKPTVAAVLRQHGAAYLDAHSLNTPQAKAWRAICACRTPALGGQCLVCSTCSHTHWQYHSCRNRHCPTCGARASDAWLQKRIAQVLDVPYLHMVFALPHEFNDLYRQQPKAVIEALFASVQHTLAEFAANPRWMGVSGGQAAFTLVLHTWSQDLGLHLHLHAIVAAGVLQDQRWHSPAKGPQYLFPIRALSQVWRGKFMQAIESTEMSAQSQRLDTAGRKALWHKDWVVYAKAPLGGAAQVLQYLSRYTHRSAIGNERIQRITEQEVFFSARATPPSLGRCRGLHAPCEPNPDHAVPRVPDRQTASDPDLGRIKAPARTAHVLRAKTASNSPMMKVQDSTHAP